MKGRFDNQRNLFDEEPEPPYQQHSETSREAAVAIAPDMGTLRGKVYAYIQQCGDDGATDEEIQSALEMNPSTERPRRIELCAMRLVRDSGRSQLTRSGRRAVVWIEERSEP